MVCLCLAVQQDAAVLLLVVFHFVTVCFNITVHKSENKQIYHHFSALLLSQDEAEHVGVGSSHQTKKQRLLVVRQLTHIHCNTHTHTHV